MGTHGDSAGWPGIWGQIKYASSPSFLTPLPASLPSCLVLISVPWRHFDDHRRLSWSKPTLGAGMGTHGDTLRAGQASGDISINSASSPSFLTPCLPACLVLISVPRRRIDDRRQTARKPTLGAGMDDFNSQHVCRLARLLGRNKSASLLPLLTLLPASLQHPHLSTPASHQRGSLTFT